MAYNVYQVGKELTGWLKIKSMIEDGCIDEQCLLDTLDGETELFESLCGLKESVLEDEIIVEGMDKHIDIMNQRRSRIKNGIEKKNTVILSAMVTANIPTIKGPLFTLSQSCTAAKVVVTNEADIPTKFWKTKDPTIDKVALKLALKDGDISGATMSNGGISLKTRIL